jgi:hypothetical protein
MRGVRSCHPERSEGSRSSGSILRFAQDDKRLLFVALFVAQTASAQKPPAIHQLGRLERVTSDSLASVGSAVAFRDGRVLVNDRIGRRVLLFDSTLQHPKVVADTTAATADAYGSRIASLVRFRGDSALMIDQSSLSMAVIDARGTIARMMAIPRPSDAQDISGAGGVDAGGRLVYFTYGPGALQGFVMLGPGDQVYRDGKPTNLARFNIHLDSAWLVRVDLSSRTLDTVTPIRIATLNRELKTDANGGLTSIVTTYDPLPIVDDWTVMRDGTIAIVRGRDYHVDWLTPDGKWSSSPKLPFDWQKLDDARKRALIDSTVARWQAQSDGIMRGGRGGGGPPPNYAPMIVAAPSIESLGTYAPAFLTLSGGGPPIFSDADGNVWIRTTTMIDGRPVYDIVNRRGEMIDRVQLPPFRTIAGFGSGVIYMAVKDAAGAVHLERARIR